MARHCETDILASYLERKERIWTEAKHNPNSQKYHAPQCVRPITGAQPCWILRNTDTISKWQMVALSAPAGLLAQFCGKGVGPRLLVKTKKTKSAAHKTKQCPSDAQTGVHLFGH